MQNLRANLKNIQEVDIYPSNEIVSLSSLTNLPTRKGLERAIISNGQIVNVVSNTYGHLPNENFYTEVETQLIQADINFTARRINRENRSFAVDYILNDDSLHIEIKNGLDKIKPMLRFTNSYDGSTKTSGNFGFYREVCKNGLHLGEAIQGFSVKHIGSIAQIVLPQIKSTIDKFFDNEYYQLKRKFEVLAETPISDLNDFVAYVTKENNLFKFEKSEKNSDPSMLAQSVIDIIKDESILLSTHPNLWTGYNAFNEVIHTKLKKSFDQQRKADSLVFDSIFSLA